MDIIEGRYKETVIHYRDNDFLVFDDKYGVSENHLDVIPTRVIEDITKLTANDIPMLEKMYQLGVNELKRRKIKYYENLNIEDYVLAGYNYPVSVKHLHLHVALPPWFHRKCWATQRFHPHHKVIHDLKKYGKVRLYWDYPDEEAVKREYERAMKNMDLILEKMSINKSTNVN